MCFLCQIFSLGWLMEFVCSLIFLLIVRFIYARKEGEKNLFDLEQQVVKASTQAL